MECHWVASLRGDPREPVKPSVLELKFKIKKKSIESPAGIHFAVMGTRCQTELVREALVVSYSKTSFVLPEIASASASSWAFALHLVVVVAVAAGRSSSSVLLALSFPVVVHLVF